MSTQPSGGSPAPATPPMPAASVRLLDSSEHFAQSAVGAYNRGDWSVFYLHLGTAMELLVKGALAHANASFIADFSRGFEPLLHLTGMGDRAKTSEFASAVRTISITDAWPRIARLIDDYEDRGALVDVLIVRRNAVVHTGTTVRGQEADILGEVGRYVPQLLRYTGRNGSGFWGESEAFVNDHAERRLTESQAAYQRKIQAALARLAELAERVGDGLDAVVLSLERSGPSEDYSRLPLACPACRHAGTAHGHPEPAWEPEYEQEGPDDFYVTSVSFQGVTLLTESFDCRVCGLVLYAEDLRTGKLTQLWFNEDDPAIEGAAPYFESQEQNYEPDDGHPWD